MQYIHFVSLCKSIKTPGIIYKKYNQSKHRETGAYPSIVNSEVSGQYLNGLYRLFYTMISKSICVMWKMKLKQLPNLDNFGKGRFRCFIFFRLIPLLLTDVAWLWFSFATIKLSKCSCLNVLMYRKTWNCIVIR